MANLLSFVHLSDIHFGQSRGGQIYVHSDVRDRLVDDVTAFFRARRDAGGSGATGILVTGDIAYSGKKPEYDAASKFLDRIATAAGCENTEVRVAPGNHDVDLNEITHGIRTNLGAIEAQGEAELDRQFADPRDRARLYERLKEYAVFAEGYGCPLDGGGGHAGEKDYAIAPGRTLKFVAWNSALVCAGRDVKGRLLLGAKQRSLPSEPGVERVVLCHHPLPWFADEGDARRFLKNRARVFLSGHEHLAEIAVEVVEENIHYLHLAAGATTPPDGYEHTYNILDFEWIPETDGLAVTVHPRVWVDARKKFDADHNRLAGAQSKRCRLGCPQFREAPRVTATPAATPPAASAPARTAPTPTAPTAVTPTVHLDAGVEHAPAPSPVTPPAEAAASDTDQFPRIRLRFFRELSRVQRLKVLVELGALPATLDGFPTMAVERKALELISSQKKLSELEVAIDNEGASAAKASAGFGGSGA